MESNDGACTNQLEREPKHACPSATARSNPPNMYTSPIGKCTKVDNYEEATWSHARLENAP